MCRAGSICFLDDEVSAAIEPLQGARNRECQEQAHQCKYGALDGGEARHGASIFLPVSQPEPPPVVQQKQRTDEKGGSDYCGVSEEDHLQSLSLGGLEVRANIPIRNCDYKLTQSELAYELRSR